MADASDKTPFELIAEHFARHGVEYVVIGGQAETLMGSPRITYDVDLCYRRTSENLKRLAAALRELSPKLRGAPPDLPFRIDETSLALGSNFTFDTRLGDLDLLGYVEPLGVYEQLLPRAEEYDLEGLKVRAIGLDDLIRIKEHIRRPKDTESLYQLRAIREARQGPRDNPSAGSSLPPAP